MSNSAAVMIILFLLIFVPIIFWFLLIYFNVKWRVPVFGASVILYYILLALYVIPKI